MEWYFEKLAIALSPQRLAHSIRVAELAEKMAMCFQLDPKRAYLAGLLHDCAHDLSAAALLRKSEEFGILVGKLERQLPFLLHGPVGAELARREYGVDDPLIFEAIYVHTIGKPQMSRFARLISLADYIEPERDFAGLGEIRQRAETNLDRALLLAFENTIRYLLAQGGLIHPQTILTRNWLLENL